MKQITIQHRTALWLVTSGFICVGRYHTQQEAIAAGVMFAEAGLTQEEYTPPRYDAAAVDMLNTIEQD